MGTSSLVLQAIIVALLLAAISGPIFWSESLTRRFMGLDKKKKKDDANKPPPKT